MTGPLSKFPSEILLRTRGSSLSEEGKMLGRATCLLYVSKVWERLLLGWLSERKGGGHEIQGGDMELDI